MINAFIHELIFIIFYEFLGISIELFMGRNRRKKKGKHFAYIYYGLICESSNMKIIVCDDFQAMIILQDFTVNHCHYWKYKNKLLEYISNRDLNKSDFLLLPSCIVLHGNWLRVQYTIK